MRVYQIFNLRTGLFYKPTSGKGRNKSNLSENGKVYVTKPNVPALLQIDNGQGYIWEKGRRKKEKEDNWKLVEYKLVAVHD